MGRFILFLIINFLGLAIGSVFTAEVSGDWYQSLPKAPWTPPGWVFGAAWTSIMILFSIFLSRAQNHLDKKSRTSFYRLFAFSWLLNVLWNPIFFYFHWIVVGLITILILTLVIFRFVLIGKREMTWEWLLVLPYFIWLLIASSLNAYVVFSL